MAEKKKGKSAEGHFATYKANKTWEKNRIRKLEKTLKAQPTNEQVKNALKCIVYRRKPSKVREWSHSWKRTAQLYKQFSGRFDRNIMSSNKDVALAALSTPGPVALNYVNVNIVDKHFFSLSSRNNLNRKD